MQWRQPWGRAGGERARRMPIGCLVDPVKKLTKLQKAYTKVTFLTHDEVLRIDRLLDFLDQDGSGAVSSDELRRIPELVFNPFGDRIVRVMDIDGSNELSVVELMDLFSIFSHRATSRAKAQILFCMFDFDEDGELGPEDLAKVIERMLFVPREAIKMGQDSGKGKMTSRMETMQGSPEELLARLDDNINTWAAEMIKEVDTTGTGTITYDEWEEEVTASDSFHDFTSFAVASKSSINNAEKRMEALKQKKARKLFVHTAGSEGARGGEMRFHNPLSEEDQSDEAQVGERTAGVQNELGEAEAEDKEVGASSGEESAAPGTSFYEGHFNAGADQNSIVAIEKYEDNWYTRHPPSELFDNKSIHLLELINSEDFNAQLAERLEPIRVPVGETVVENGVRVDAIYFIALGAIGVVPAKGVDAPANQVLGPGDVFGERGILSGQSTGAAYVAQPTAAGSRADAKLYRLPAEQLTALLLANPEAKETFLARPEVRIAAMLRALHEDYTTTTFKGTRPPSLEERMVFHTDESKRETATEEELSDLDAMLQVPGVLIKAPLDLSNQLVKQLPENRLWSHSITAVQAKFGRGVSTTFQLQRWIGGQNLRVAILWLILVIAPRQYALFRFCDDKWEVFYNESFAANCSSKIVDTDSLNNYHVHGRGYGFIAADLEQAQQMEAAALKTAAGGLTADRVWSAVMQHSAYAPAMGDSFYLQHFTIAYTVAIVFIYSTTIRSLFIKMHEVLAGLPVLGSGTESVTGFEAKSDLFFSVLSQYDFSIREAASVAALQDGIYTHLEVLEAARTKDNSAKRTSADRLRGWAGWVLYGCLVGLCGLCIYLILSEDWVTEQCCACGCRDCNDDSLRLTNTSIVPDLCQDPLFTCDNCFHGVRNPLMSYKESGTQLGTIIQPLLLSLTTAVIPFLTKKISLVEKRKDLGDEMRVTLIRVFTLKMFNIGLMFVSRAVKACPILLVHR